MRNEWNEGGEIRRTARHSFARLTGISQGVQRHGTALKGASRDLAAPHGPLFQSPLCAPFNPLLQFVSMCKSNSVQPGQKNSDGFGLVLPGR